MDQLLPSRKAKVEINDLSTELLFTILSEVRALITFQIIVAR